MPFLVLLLFFLPTAAYGHAIYADQVGSFYSGLLHPVSVIQHVMILVGLALWLGGRAREGGLKPFTLSLLAGLAVSTIVPVAIPVSLMLVVALSVGALLASDFSPKKFQLTLLTSVCGLLVGLDSGPEEAFGLSTILIVLGTFVGVCLIVYDIFFIRSRFRHEGMLVASRIAGSWIAACALMVLALSLSK